MQERWLFKFVRVRFDVTCQAGVGTENEFVFVRGLVAGNASSVAQLAHNTALELSKKRTMMRTEVSL
jgi:uncharacterized metal-binding protein